MLEIANALDLLLVPTWSIIDLLDGCACGELLTDVSRGAVAETLISTQTLWSIVIVAAAALIQAMVGFASAMFALPLLLWVGNDLMESQVLIITAMLPQNLFAVWKLRKSIDLREVIWPAAIRIAALPIGIAGLAVVLTWSASRINQFVGVLILLAIALQALVGIEWKNARKPFWLVAVFGGSGVLQGISGMSGPPMVMWVHAQRYSSERARAFLFAMYLTNFIPQIVLLWWKFGDVVFQAMLIGLLSVPLVLPTATLGLKLGSWLGDRWLRGVSMLGLVLIALSSLLEPLIQSWWND